MIYDDNIDILIDKEYMIMNIKVLSFDIFQTLVDVNQRIPQIWKGILGDAYTSADGIRGARGILEHYPTSLQKAITSDRFYTMKEIYLDCADNAIKQASHSVTAETVVEHLLFQHSMAPLYEDVTECMKRLHKKYRIILSSDSNHIMVDGLLKNFIYDDLFISEDLKCYKENLDGGFFRQVVESIGILPGEMLHIGDSRSDILGARRIGVASCWINREHRLWRHEIQPEYEIHDLWELEALLNF